GSARRRLRRPAGPRLQSSPLAGPVGDWGVRTGAIHETRRCTAELWAIDAVVTQPLHTHRAGRLTLDILAAGESAADHPERTVLGPVAVRERGAGSRGNAGGIRATGLALRHATG